MTAGRARAGSALCLCLALSACMAPRPPPMPAAVPDPSLAAGGTCNADAARFVLGKTVDERLGEFARQRAGARLVRVLRPGVPADQDDRASRLDLEVDGLGRAVAVRCG